ncbi:MAG: bifunctional precorrin-2 dehydrogenase/sirohydrochlorin ferrochelatase [Deltaproteobacteria bacterium]|nr:bifunctional precorrin-2 dehydrogenase/sirohydrochlorin ferrochelatase [Deltaproteobacteria bacterium]
MSYYPVFLDLTGKKAIVVGGGSVAERKIETLLEYGAAVHVISRELTPELQKRLDNGEINILANEFDEGLIEGAFLIIIATDDRTVNKMASEAAKKRNILVNAVDKPEECSFIVPSVIRRGDLVIAVSTSGRSPALAKRIGETLSSQFGEEYELFLKMMGRIRKDLLSKDMEEFSRGRIFHELVDSRILESIRKQDLTAAASELERILKRPFSQDDVADYLRGE